MSLIPVKAALHCFLVIAFMSMQFSSAHIHLPKSHQHDGSQHQHDKLGHAHALSGHHEDAIDSMSSDGEYQLVDISQSYVLLDWNHYYDGAFLTSYNTNSLSPSQTEYLIPLPSANSRHANWLSYSTVRLRAPPLAFA